MVWDVIFSPDILAAMIRVGTPILLVALGCAISLKAGIFNIAVEGQMLLGAFLAVVASTLLGSLWLGLLVTVLITVIVALIYGLVTITLEADQIIAGLGVNMLSLGLTSWLLQSVLNSPGGFSTPATPKLPSLKAGWIVDLPFLGQILEGQHIITFGSWGIAILVYLFIHRSKYGLRLRATGEHPVAATTVGINPLIWQYIAIALTGVLCALAGSALALGSIRLFTKGMTAGRGFIAFAASSFAAGNVPGTIAVSLMFALFSSLAIHLEGLGLPTRVVQLIPYLVTFIALIFARRRVKQ